MQTKLYTGKLFTLKNIKRISYTKKNTPRKYGIKENDDGSFSANREDFGEAVLVLDERAKRVKIAAAFGVVWISKYYLYQEHLGNGQDKPLENLNKGISNISKCIEKDENNNLLQETLQLLNAVKMHLEEK